MGEQHAATHSEWHVTQCECGQITVRLGPTRVEFTREEFARLHRLIQEAMTHFRVTPSDAAVFQVGDVTH